MIPEFCNQRRFYRIDTMLPVFVDVVVTKDRIHVDKGDFGALPVTIFDTLKMRWLNHKMEVFLERKRCAERLDERCTDYFQMLHGKVEFFREMLLYLAEGENPYLGSLASRIKGNFRKHYQKITFDQDFSESAPRSTAIMRLFDRRMMYTLERIEHVFVYSKSGILQPFHLAADQALEKVIQELRAYADYAPLAATFVALFDYITALEDIYGWIMKKNDPHRHQYKQPVNLSCGGIRLSLPFRIKTTDKVSVELFIDPVPGVGFTHEDNPLVLEGHCVRSDFDAESANFDTVINFEFVPDYVYKRIDSYMISLEMNELAGELKKL